MIVNKENLKHLNNFASKKKKRKKKYIIILEKREEIVAEKISKNWKTRRKRPPDKEVDIELISLS
jgi:hypothetical protein